MAKKIKTKYTKNRNRVTSYIRRLRKKGLQLDLYFPTERELRKEGIKGTELAKLTRQLKTYTPKVLTQLATSPNYSDADSNTQGFTPPPINIMEDAGYMMYENVFDEFISKISEPIPQRTTYGTKRRSINIETIERSRATIYSLTMREVAKIGKGKLGWRLQKHNDEVQDLILAVLYGSDAVKIATATSRLASIITGGLTVPELMDLGDEEEYNEDWELPN